MKWLVQFLLLAVLCFTAAGAQGTSADSTQTGVSFVMVEPGVKLEVKDWGGTGRPVVLLAGLGGTLHGFDQFAPRLTGKYHVYGITRRGYGASSAPVPVGDNYAADRLGDDVLSVLDQMKIERPILIGHSFAGEELSSIGSRFPDRVAGLVYLDAANRYAFSPVHRGDFRVDTLELRRELTASLDAISPAEARKAIDRLQEMLPQFQTDLTEEKTLWATAPDMSAKDYDEQVKERSTREGQIEKAALDGERRYTEIKCPVLAIFALPHDHGLPPGPKRDAVDAWEMKTFGPLADSFEAGVPTAHVVRIPHAKHGVFESNPTEVVQDIEDFIGGLRNQ
jgi:pimeloyl-ACP methyl ester carboxylesterase